MHAIELPVGLPAVMHQDSNPFGQNPLSFDCFHPAPGVDAVPSVGVGRDRMQPMQFSRDPQTRFVGMGHWRLGQGLGNPVDRGLKQVARLIHPRQQGGRGNLEMEQVGDQLRSASIWQQLALRQMHPQGADIRAVLHRFGHASPAGKALTCS